MSGREAGASDLAALADAGARTIAQRQGGWDLLWAALPTALLDHPVATARGGHVLGPARTILSGVARSRGSTLTSVGDVLFAYEGANPGATLDPVIAGFARSCGQTASPRAFRPEAGSLFLGVREARRATAVVERELGGRVPVSLERALQAAVRARARAAPALDALRPRLLVVASQHSTAARSLIHAARERSVPTAYLAHAPVADTYQYRDLPTDFAGLRGAREVDFYRSLGAVRPPDVVGNPQGRVDAPAALDPGAPVIFAPRPQPVERVRAQVSAIDAATSEVVVSPHPRMRSSTYDGLWPAHWSRHDGWTAELLRAGHPCTIQHSSGVAWESMAHGVPVIELALEDATTRPAYLVIQEPAVRICSSASVLGPMLHEARQDAADVAARRRLQDWASEWCAATGADAVDRAVAWIHRCLATDAAPGPLLDHWGRVGSDR